MEQVAQVPAGGATRLVLSSSSFEKTWLEMVRKGTSVHRARIAKHPDESGPSAELSEHQTRQWMYVIYELLVDVDLRYIFPAVA